MSQYLRVGLGLELDTVSLKPLSENGGIFDDSIVNHSHPTGTVYVRVSVLNRHATMGGPPGVCDPNTSREVVWNYGLKVLDPADLLVNL